MFKKFGIVLTVLSAALLFFGCSERESNVTDPGYGVRDGLTDVYIFPGGHSVSEELAFTMYGSVRKVPHINLKVYTPPNPDEPDSAYSPTGPRYPVLYLMSPFRGNDSYYFNHGLVAIADKMIYEGQIKPMIIVCIDGSSGYGGCFYGDTWFGGKYAKAICDIENDPISGSMIDYVDALFQTLDATRDTRAISGLGMGGYGAVKIAAMYPENFSAVSAISAPLDFDGAAGTGGFVPIFKDVINNLSGGGDYVSLAEYRAMDTSYSYPLRTMMMAAGVAFTPHVIDIDNIIDLFPPMALDSTFIDDTLTYINPEGGIQFHLPFDTAGNLYQPIWNMWLDNNTTSIIENNPGCFDDMEVALFTTEDDEYGFNVQTVNFASWLQGHLNMRGINRDLMPINFDGYNGYSSDGGRMLYDILPQILKFHSDNFPD